MLLPKNLQARFKLKAKSKYNTRTHQTFDFNLKGTGKKNACISINGPKLWENVNTTIKDCTNIKNFVKNLKVNIIEQYKCQ